MLRIACWTCALWALAGALVYERCELARELRALGVPRNQISTWVCIAYHESRLDTAAYNPHSGDHGIFQISQLYWCGHGKACGVPCSAFRDEDISDDLECALKIREEHSRFQGDGFLAWVVYPQHCKQNTKKYIVDCDINTRFAQVKNVNRARLELPYDEENATFTYNPNIDNLKPPYFAINSFLQGGFSKVLEETDYNDEPIDWINYKVDNIDELTLPVLNGESVKLSPRRRPTTTTTTLRPSTTTISSLPFIERIQIGPWNTPWGKKYVESKQFRKMVYKDEREKPSETRISNPNYTPLIQTTSTGRPTVETTTKQYTTRISTTTTLNTYPSTKIASKPKESFISTTASKPAVNNNWSDWLTTKPTILSTTSSRPVSSTLSPSKSVPSTTTTRKPVTSLSSTIKPTWSLATTTSKPTPLITNKPFWSTTSKTTSKTNTVSSSTKAWNSASTSKPILNTAGTYPVRSTTSTKPTWRTPTSIPTWSISTTTTSKPNIISTTKPLTTTTTKKQISTSTSASKVSTVSTTKASVSTIKPFWMTTITIKPSLSTASKPSWNSTTKKSTSTTTSKPITPTTNKPLWRETTTVKPRAITTAKPVWNSISTIPASSTVAKEKYNWNTFATKTQSSITTSRPLSSTSITTSRPLTTRKPSTSSSTTKNTYKPIVVTSTTLTPKTTSQLRHNFASTASTQRYISVSSTTRKPLSTKLSIINSTASKADFAKYSFTTPSTTRESLKYSTKSPSLTTSNPLSSKTRNESTTDQSKTTRSIFDLYLNPTKATRTWSLKFPEFSSDSKFKIFADGTTTPAPSRDSGADPASPRH